MKNRKNSLTGIIAIGAIAIFAFTNPARAQQSKIGRVELQQHDLSIPGHEAVQLRVDFAPGAVAGKHKHPGEEVIYVLEGVIEYQVEGKPPVSLKAGDVLFIPSGAVHSAKNVGSGNAKELATYIVKKGEPLITPIK
ncbi:cupin domain-containing protein [Mucilaginibacter sp.]|uniref:cupin domain-containing protein n=1 Tax=Mucilaginibacter sp. TaxID=1882438 RepID=UPI0032631521